MIRWGVSWSDEEGIFGYSRSAVQQAAVEYPMNVLMIRLDEVSMAPLYVILFPGHVRSIMMAICGFRKPEYPLKYHCSYPLKDEIQRRTRVVKGWTIKVTCTSMLQVVPC